LAQWILALADDLTGALEVGARFACTGARVRVTTHAALDARPAEEVLVVDTETRHVPAEAARRTVRDVAIRALPFRPALIYKKTDSTLRGNIAAEFAALLDVYPGRPLVYAPAYPELGRTVRAGHLYVDGVPVHETAFGADRLNPVRDSAVAALLDSLTVSIVDGEKEEDVEAAARAIASANPMPLAAGPAALAGALAVQVDLPRSPQAPWPSLGRCLLVSGSLHPASRAQVQHARSHGWRMVQPRCTPAALAKGGCYVLAPGAGGEGLERAAAVGEIVGDLLRQSEVDTLIVFGGDTAFAIHRALGAPEFLPLGEVVPGVPVSRCGGRTWITKAGGFGLAAILCDIQRLLA